jgi:kumamolisin
VLTGVFGPDERPQARFFRPRADAALQYVPPAVALAYDFPPGGTGAGECVALIELGGGYRTADLSAYFASLHDSPPLLEAVSVDGATNAASTADRADGEVMLDIEIVGSTAYRAARSAQRSAAQRSAAQRSRSTSLPTPDQGFLDAVSTAVHHDTRRPSVVSISWGGAESTWAAQAMDEMEQALADAAAMGVTVAVAAGDSGSTDGRSDGLQHVDFPASAPHALGCGGTRPVLLDGAISARDGVERRAQRAPTAVGSATTSRCRAIRRPRGFRPRRILVATSAAACPPCPATRTPTRATRSASMA